MPWSSVCPTPGSASRWPRCSSRSGREPTLGLEELQAHCRLHLAGHKVPRRAVAVDDVPRSPSGKPDYPWAKQVANTGTATPG